MHQQLLTLLTARLRARIRLVGLEVRVFDFETLFSGEGVRRRAASAFSSCCAFAFRCRIPGVTAKESIQRLQNPRTFKNILTEILRLMLSTSQWLELFSSQQVVYSGNERASVIGQNDKVNSCQIVVALVLNL